MKKEIYGSKRYKNLIERLIQIFCKKVNKGEMLYQAVYREIRKETGLYIASKYLTKDNRFNCNMYTIDIME